MGVLRIRVGLVVASVATMLVTSCGAAPPSRDRNIESVPGSRCPRPGQMATVSKVPVVCGKTSAGNIWYATVSASGKSVPCTSVGTIREKQGAVWVCGVLRGRKSWRATLPQPKVGTSVLTSSEPGAAIAPQAPESGNQEAASVPVSSVDDGSGKSTNDHDASVTAEPTFPSLSQATVETISTTTSVKPVVRTSVPSTAVTAPAPVPSTFVNRDYSNGLKSVIVRGAFASGSTVYAATYGVGLAISTDDGETFSTRTTDDGLGSRYVTGVFVSNSVVYVATDGGGLSVSTDGGEKFTNRTFEDGLADDFVTAVFASNSTVFAATEDGLSISSDGGKTFANRTTSDGLGSNFIRGVFAVGGQVYAATERGLGISSDGGSTFVNRTTSNGLGSNMVYGSFASGSAVYAATGQGLSISRDGGETFMNRTTSNGLGSNTVLGVAVSGANVYAATAAGLAVSTDGGETFTSRTTSNGLGSNFVRGVFVSGARVYACTSRGLSISN